MQMINLGKILQNLLVVGVQIMASEVSATPEPKPLVRMDPIGPPPQPQPRIVKIISDAPLPVGTRLVTDQPSVWEPAPVSIATTPATQKPDLPTTAETLKELKHRLAKELYRVELDLQSGARISGKPCDCLSKAKHSAGIEATAEELMSYEANPLYGKVISWVNSHATVFEPSEIAKRPPEYYQAIAPEVRAFRKEVMGTEKMT
jgi:hypothetical protein